MLKDEIFFYKVNVGHFISVYGLKKKLALLKLALSVSLNTLKSCKRLFSGAVGRVIQSGYGKSIRRVSNRPFVPFFITKNKHTFYSLSNIKQIFNVLNLFEKKKSHRGSHEFWPGMFFSLFFA